MTPYHASFIPYQIRFELNGHTTLAQSTAQKQSAASMTFRAVSTMQEINITSRRRSTETRHPPRNATHWLVQLHTS